MKRRHFPLCLLILGWLSEPAKAQHPSDDFFESRVRPLLVESCYPCHAGKEMKGSFQLDTKEHLLKGGESGAVIVPGEPEKSLLVTAVRYTDLELQMPPSGRLPDARIADLVEWIRRGAPDPRTEASQSTPPAPSVAESRPPARNYDPKVGARNHWAFRPPHDELPPIPGNAASARNGIDLFTLAALADQNLDPAPEADRRTLIRRLAFDLTGLPPSPEEVAAFVSDARSDAYEHVVDRLLASSHYGERQARAWLDLARYADSNGQDENLAMSEAWRYRDWVVRAFNTDLPYDRFLTWQLAGDLLPEPDDEAELADHLTATGFLVLGPKMLAEQDKQKLVMDVVDEQIDVTSKAMLGLTLSCARCHDHKFDPLTTRDYYALAGIMKSTSALANLAFVSRWREVPLAKRQHLAARDAAQKELDAARHAATARANEIDDGLARRGRAMAGAALAEGARRAGSVQIIEPASFARGNVIVDRSQWGSDACVIVRSGNGERPQFAEYDVTVETPGRYELLARAAVQESRPIDVTVDGVTVARGALARPTGSWFPDGQTWRAMATVELCAGPHVLRIERQDHLPHLSAFALVPTSHGGEIPSDTIALLACIIARPAPHERPLVDLMRGAAACSSGPFAIACTLTARRLAEDHQLSPLLAHALDAPAPRDLAALAARYQSAFAAVEQAWDAARAKDANVKRLADDAPEAARQFLFGDRGPFAVDAAMRARRAAAGDLAALAKLDARVTELAAHPMPPIPSALGVTDGEIVDIPVHVRGSHLNLGPSPVRRDVPAVLAVHVPAPAMPVKQSGRLEFARWLTAPDHPLTARVMVNRIWQQHFGFGLVRSASNFGLRGEKPTHPELLDWLAHEFVRRDWSVKAMHRLIVTSRTYRQAVVTDARALTIDPENRLLWRQNRRRLDAESIRDGLLACAGTLDRTMGGTLLGTADGEYVTNDQSGNAAQYGAPRRTLYLPVIRNAIYDVLSAFDYADAGMPLERRSTTVAPTQSLLMLNSPLVLDQSLALARRLLAQTTLDDPARVERVWQIVDGRPPAPSETERALAFVRSSTERLTPTMAQDARLAAWQSLCQALFASNAFLYLE